MQSNMSISRILLLGLLIFPIVSCSTSTEPTPAKRPTTPVLTELGYEDIDGNYLVSWSSTQNTTSYTLHESNNQFFSVFNQVYSGPQTNWSASNKPSGTYYYRVQSKNQNESSCWSNTERVTVNPPETITTPGIPVGPSSGIVGQSLDFTASEATSNLGHPLFYQFRWSNQSSSWLSTPSHSIEFTYPGTYAVQVRAQCRAHTSTVSNWSNSKQVVISNPTHEVRKPNTPSGPTIAYVDNNYTYSSSGATCSLGHSVEYRFNWNDLPHSDWSSSTSAQKAWDYALRVNIKAQARCSVNHTVISDWSWFLPVDIQEPETISGSPRVCGSAAVRVNVESVWWGCNLPESSLAHDLEWRINWDDGTFSEWSTTNQYRSFSEPGTYNLKTQARCIRHPNVVSSWGASSAVSVSE